MKENNICPKCAKGFLVVIRHKTGRSFLGCTKYKTKEKCTYKERMSTQNETYTYKRNCPKCFIQLQVRFKDGIGSCVKCGYPAIDNTGHSTSTNKVWCKAEK